MTTEQQPRQAVDEPMPRLLPLHGVCRLTWLSPATVYAEMAAGKFPPPALTGERTRWASEEVHAWLAERVRPR